jgi:hypothetical protein
MELDRYPPPPRHRRGSPRPARPRLSRGDRRDMAALGRGGWLASCIDVVSAPAWAQRLADGRVPVAIVAWGDGALVGASVAPVGRASRRWRRTARRHLGRRSPPSDRPQRPLRLGASAAGGDGRRPGDDHVVRRHAGRRATGRGAGQSHLVARPRWSARRVLRPVGTRRRRGGHRGLRRDLQARGRSAGLSILGPAATANWSSFEAPSAKQRWKFSPTGCDRRHRTPFTVRIHIVRAQGDREVAGHCPGQHRRRPERMSARLQPSGAAARQRSRNREGPAAFPHRDSERLPQGRRCCRNGRTPGVPRLLTRRQTDGTRRARSILSGTSAREHQRSARHASGTL